MDPHEDFIDLLRQFAARHDPDRLDDALTALAPHDEPMVSVLAEALSNDDEEVRLLAVEMLRELGPKSEAALPAMIRALEDKDRILRIASLPPVAAFGKRATDAISILETWLTSDDEFSRISAAGHIVMIDRSRAEEMAPSLEKTLASNSIMISRQAQWLIDELGGTLPRLREASP